jgi:hypothetical protein
VEADARKLAENAVGSVIHGDLCFSNILYDLRSQICKFVDPRGSFGEIGLVGDPRYDVAKLYHSVYGLYDFMTNDLFQVAAQGGDVQLDIRTGPQHKQILERFEKVFFGAGGFEKREVLLICGLIFAGIAALHYDAPQRQLAMYARAVQMFGELYTHSAVAAGGKVIATPTAARSARGCASTWTASSRNCASRSKRTRTWPPSRARRKNSARSRRRGTTSSC